MKFQVCHFFIFSDEFPKSKCSQLTCGGSFSFPISFTNGVIYLDLGRNAVLKIIDVVLLINVFTAASVEYNVSLAMSQLNDNDLSKACSLISQNSLTFRFDCLNNTGRYLTVAHALENSTFGNFFPIGQQKQHQIFPCKLQNNWKPTKS